MTRVKFMDQPLEDPAYLAGPRDAADPANRTHPGLDLYGSPFVLRSMLPVPEAGALERKLDRLLARDHGHEGNEAK